MSERGIFQQTIRVGKNTYPHLTIIHLPTKKIKGIQFRCLIELFICKLASVWRCIKSSEIARKMETHTLVNFTTKMDHFIWISIYENWMICMQRSWGESNQRETSIWHRNILAPIWYWHDCYCSTVWLLVRMDWLQTAFATNRVALFLLIISCSLVFI